MVGRDGGDGGERREEGASQIQLFNLASMAGVSPGTRTQRFQRVQLLPLQTVAEPVWAQILWYDDPPACALFLPGEDGRPLPEPLIQVAAPDAAVHHTLQEALEQAGWGLQTCGLCRHWQRETGLTGDGLAVGRCRWGASTAPSTVLALQSGLALRCPHWEQGEWPATDPVEMTQASAVKPLRKIAEISESKLPFWRRLWLQALRSVRPAPVALSWEEKLAERSGVGAGAEPCFACQGRIANLGAMAVETDEGDTQTFSVWRCRLCFTTYLNDWVDRWVRLDNLETEESYYRVAPSEAGDLLNLIHAVQGGEHPARRSERSAQRKQFRQFLAGRMPLSHQIRQGR
jgi:hypothetical protein